MKKVIYSFLVLTALALAVGTYKIHTMPAINKEGFSLQAADISSTPFNEIFKGKITAVPEKNVEQNSRYSRITETLEVTLLSGSEKGKQVVVNYDDTLTNQKLQEVKAGDTVVVGKITAS